MFEYALKKALTDKRIMKIPILFVTQTIIVLEEMGLLKECDEYVPDLSYTDNTR